jgi:predicted dehydrogenase
MRCLDHVVVIGGGRWARVIIEHLCNLVPEETKILIYSRQNADGVSGWVKEKKFKNHVQIFPKWLSLISPKTSAVIVANAVRDHEEAVEWALNAEVPVLVEKPIALTAKSAERLINLAQDKNMRFAAAHVFLFASYLDNFSKLVKEKGGAQSLNVQWTDPVLENRYGEDKSYDPSVSIFWDLLPHILSILSTLTLEKSSNLKIKQVLRGGAQLEIAMMLGDIPCFVHLARNSQKRRRIIDAEVQGETFQLDFSEEPGLITCATSSICADLEWKMKPSPIAQMLKAFLVWTAGGEADCRLDLQLGLKACQLSEQLSIEYDALVTPWLMGKFESLKNLDEDLLYAFRELIHSRLLKEKH